MKSSNSLIRNACRIHTKIQLNLLWNRKTLLQTFCRNPSSSFLCISVHKPTSQPRDMGTTLYLLVKAYKFKSTMLPKHRTHKHHIATKRGVNTTNAFQLQSTDVQHNMRTTRIIVRTAWIIGATLWKLQRVPCSCTVP